MPASKLKNAPLTRRLNRFAPLKDTATVIMVRDMPVTPQQHSKVVAEAHADLFHGLLHYDIS